MKTNNFTFNAFGNVGKTVKINKYENHTKVYFSFAVKTADGKTEWYQLVAWRKNENAAQLDSIKTGACLKIFGEISQDTFKNKDGETVTTTVMTARTWEVIEKKNNAPADEPAEPEENQEAQ